MSAGTADPTFFHRQSHNSLFGYVSFMSVCYSQFILSQFYCERRGHERSL